MCNQFLFIIGCGSGRYLHINKLVYKLGSDICIPLVQYAKEKGHEVMVADNLMLPYRHGVFDAVVSIGVVHHFSSYERRVQALKELTRVLSPGGRLLVCVWAFEQKHRRVCYSEFILYVALALIEINYLFEHVYNCEFIFNVHDFCWTKSGVFCLW